MIRIGLIQFPGSNCERETALAVKRAGMEPVECLWNESREQLRQLDGYILIGGFSYGDRSRAGIIAALGPIMHEIKAQSELGKPVLGLCNGAQILVESGMIPGFYPNYLTMALTENKRIKDGKILGVGYYNAWVTMRLTEHARDNAFTRGLSTTEVIKLPVAHAEGRFIMPDALFAELEYHGLNVFKYCDEQGQIVNDFPVNPNGSVGNIAAILNHTGNVMAMMPHPERTMNGDPIFMSMRDYIAQGYKQGVRNQAPRWLFSASTIISSSDVPRPVRGIQKSCVEAGSLDPADKPRDVEIETTDETMTDALFFKPKRYQKPSTHHEFLIQLIIADNHALTVQNTLKKLGFLVGVRRFVHWDIHCDSPEILKQIQHSHVLFCPRKEQEINYAQIKNKKSLAYLVRAKDNLKGLEILQTLKSHYAIHKVQTIHHSVLWQFTSETNALHEVMNHILLTNIIGNPYAHEYYEYEG